ncbi:MAG: SRPBCC family protein [Candidatus Microbacterium phytovorans]|uniref:SRPBCC family protein n=1 Tax=Candidatus Microbacterium phytovorans TaxID=3121374 RepID=A0AAJ5W0A4_9MICO|nr:SRPBCC family protein [Microbacterium sp.]WEK13135.1 MAG: SRPBCC family protein [Microbacterium sp.]
MSTYIVTRSIETSASPSRVHAFVDDFRHWAAWSPWEDLDPSMRRAYSGADSGVGAHYSWTGDGKVGQGEMTIESSTPEAIGIRLEFIKPFKALCPTRFEFTPVGEGTRISWTMQGENRGLMVVLAPLLRIQKSIEKDFDRGLAKLKAVAESS